MASFPQLSQAHSPFSSVGARVAEAAPEVRLGPSQDPGLSLGLGEGRRSAGDFWGFRALKGGSEG